MKNKDILVIGKIDCQEFLFEEMLGQEGYGLTVVEDPLHAIRAASESTFRLIIIKTQIKLWDGFELLQHFKLMKKDQKVIIMSDIASAADEVKSLDLDASDYLCGNMIFEVIKRRIERIFNKVEQSNDIVKSDFENIVVDLNRKRVYQKNKCIDLTETEYRLLVYFLSCKNQILSRQEIVDEVWNRDGALMDLRIVDTFVKKIRAKLKIRSIRSVRGRGYEWEE